MLRRTGCLFACAALSGSLGCTERSRADAGPAAPAPAAPAPAPAAPAPTPRAADAPASSGLEAARRLALAAPAGASPIDREIEALSRRLERAPGGADLWSALGHAWIRKARASGDPSLHDDRAGACAELALALAGDDRASLNLRGLVLLHGGRFAEARDAAEQVLARDEGDALALGTLSDAALELGLFEVAARAAQRMVDQRPGLPSYARAAHLRWLQGDAATAKRIIRLAIDAGDPREPEALAWTLSQAAMMLWHEGDNEAADRVFARALAAQGEYPPALAGRARVALARGAWGRAVELLERAHRQSPDTATAWLLGDARTAAGDHAGAAEAYAGAVDAGRRSDRRTLALYYATKGLEREEALRLAAAERGLRADIYTEDTHAWALYRAGKLPEARAASDKALSLGTRDARLLYHAGAIRIALGDLEEGERLVRTALDLNPRFDMTGAAEAERLLARRKRRPGSAR
ncbi:tetratricopeptide repeat protein [Sorangium sp. So ce1389]|uniref:tetratricopeptide repeat protein n=1 Tax=Sorangium sp. So ce1389 TaxID=3133336 RepID=UPI003F5DB467